LGQINERVGADAAQGEYGLLGAIFGASGEFDAAQMGLQIGKVTTYSTYPQAISILGTLRLQSQPPP